jgi:predicted nucleic acid-binding protein
MDFVVLDTNVIVSALRSHRGASFAILRSIGREWVPLISVPLILEYEELLGSVKRNSLRFPSTSF